MIMDVSMYEFQVHPPLLVDFFDFGLSFLDTLFKFGDTYLENSVLGSLFSISLGFLLTFI